MFLESRKEEMVIDSFHKTNSILTVKLEKHVNIIYVTY